MNTIFSTAASIITELLNIIEIIFQSKEELQEENQKLKDELNRLKGEQGKPDIKGKNNNRSNNDHSSEEERKDSSKQSDKSKRNRKSRNITVQIDREEICQVDRDTLPKDAQFKGYSDYIVQDIKIITDNVKYQREIFYSPSTGKTYAGKLPKGIEGEGEFGIGIRSLIPLLKSECNMSEKGILDLFQNFGISISSAYISNRRTKGYDIFHNEKDEIYKIGLSLTIFQQIDDTGARLFSKATGYADLDDRISKTLNKKQELLLVLKYPELPIHNNASELAARVQARDRDVSLHTMSEAGTRVKDTFMTISQTAKKLGVRTYEYIYDRVSGACKMPSLADLMLERGGVPLDL